MTPFEFIIAFFTIAAPICSALAWMKISLDKKFDKIDERFDKLERKFDARFERVEDKIDSVQVDIKKLNIRVAHIEGAYFGKELPKHVVIGED